MKRHMLLMCGLLCVAQVPALDASTPGTSQGVEMALGPKIKILLEKDVSSAFLEAKGSFRVLRKESGTVLSSGSSAKRFVIHALQDGLRWGEEYPDVYQVTIVPTSPSSALYVNGVQYRGNLSVYHVRDNKITIVNEVSLEEYLRSTLALQYDSSLAQEAMLALAITARTEAYQCTLRGQSTRPWDITMREAGYYGCGVTHRTNGVDRAVRETSYMVLEPRKGDAPCLQQAKLAATRAHELANKGYNAQQILQTAFPHSKIGATIKAEDVSIR